MDRRNFIKTAIAVPVMSVMAAPGPYSNNTPSMWRVAGFLNIPERLEEEFVTFNSYPELVSYRQQVFDSCTRFNKDEFYRDYAQGEVPLHIRLGAPAQGFHAWTLFVAGENGNDLLIYRDAKYPFVNKQGFRHWLKSFSPENWDHVAMVPRLYEQYVYGFQSAHNTIHLPHPWLDTLLQPTRGKIFFRYQVEAIVRRACTINNRTEWADELLRGNVDYLNRFEGLVFDDGRILSEVIEDRGAYQGILFDRIDQSEVENNYMAGTLWQWHNSN